MSLHFQSFYTSMKPDTQYKDPTFKGPKEQYTELIQNSTTLYIGNLSETVYEERLWELFSLVGKIKRVIMGISKLTNMPCKFCFVEFYERLDAENGVLLFNGFRLDNKYLNVDYDYGYCEGREYGRKERRKNVGGNHKRQRYY